jgi:L-ascorbate metabolism protein UlaG (beta-lactamase superfamily)
MRRMSVAVCVLLVGWAVAVMGQQSAETDLFNTSGGDLKITLIGHGSLMFEFGGKVIHVDPYSQMADYTRLPKADTILITHEHGDHLDLKALEAVRTDKTQIVLTRICAEQVKGGMVMENGDTRIVDGLKIEAVPAYNLVNRRPTGEFYHPKGDGNGYVITFGDKRVYIAGDTENIPEMKALKEIDIAFLPMNIPNTMTPKMVADAAKAFRPKILYPYHIRYTDVAQLVTLLQEEKGIEVRLRNIK